jgi:hypothetical protein
MADVILISTAVGSSLLDKQHVACQLAQHFCVLYVESSVCGARRPSRTFPDCGGDYDERWRADWCDNLWVTAPLGYRCTAIEACGGLTIDC